MGITGHPATATPLNRGNPKGLPYKSHDANILSSMLPSSTPPSRPHPDTHMTPQPTPEGHLRIPEDAGYIEPKPRPKGQNPIPFTQPRQPRQPHYSGYIPPQPRRSGYNTIPIDPEPIQPVIIPKKPKSEVGTQVTQPQSRPNAYMYEGKLIKPIPQEKVDELSMKKKTIESVVMLNPNRFQRKPHGVYSRPR